MCVCVCVCVCVSSPVMWVSSGCHLLQNITNCVKQVLWIFSKYHNSKYLISYYFVVMYVGMLLSALCCLRDGSCFVLSLFPD